MLADHLRGDRAAALRRFARCRAVLAEALGVEPSAQTAALHEAILRGGSPARPPAAPVRYADSEGARIAYRHRTLRPRGGAPDARPADGRPA